MYNLIARSILLKEEKSLFPEECRAFDSNLNELQNPSITPPSSCLSPEPLVQDIGFFHINYLLVNSYQHAKQKSIG